MDLSNSSIQPWLDFNGTIPEDLPPCYLGYLTSETDPQITTFDPNYKSKQIRCDEVCHITKSSLSEPLDINLLTCGMWATTMSSAQYLSDPSNETGFRLTVTDDFDDQFYSDSMEIFGPLGFRPTPDAAFLALVTEAVTEYLSLLLWSGFSNVLDQKNTPGACSYSALFGPFALHEWITLQPDDFTTTTPEDRIKNSVAGLRVCIETICTSGTLNPDLTGIGVFSAFVIQVAIAIIAGVTLIALSRIRLCQNPTKDYFTDIMVVSLVEFHRAQCCFAVAIQIATILLTREAAPTHDMTVPLELTLSNVGSIPVTFVLICLCHCGRPSWYLKILSLVTFLCSTVVLMQYTVYLGIDTGGIQHFSPANPLKVWQREGRYPDTLCGTSNTASTNALLSNPLLFWGAWASWAYCFFWIFSMIFGKSFLHHLQQLPPSKKIRATVLKSRLVQFISVWAGKLLFTLTWTICIAFLVYSLALYFQNSLVQMTWTFGQIVAVTAWAPFVVEFAYLLVRGVDNGSTYRYPPPWRTIRKP